MSKVAFPLTVGLLVLLLSLGTGWFGTRPQVGSGAVGTTHATGSSHNLLFLSEGNTPTQESVARTDSDATLKAESELVTYLLTKEDPDISAAASFVTVLNNDRSQGQLVKVIISEMEKKLPDPGIFKTDDPTPAEQKKQIEGLRTLKRFREITRSFIVLLPPRNVRAICGVEVLRVCMKYKDVVGAPSVHDLMDELAQMRVAPDQAGIDSRFRVDHITFSGLLSLVAAVLTAMLSASAAKIRDSVSSVLSTALIDRTGIAKLGTSRPSVDQVTFGG